MPAFSPHDLRHRRVSVLHLGGMPWTRIGELVGHDDVMTNRAHVHARRGRRTRARLREPHRRLTAGYGLQNPPFAAPDIPAPDTPWADDAISPASSPHGPALAGTSAPPWVANAADAPGPSTNRAITATAAQPRFFIGPLPSCGLTSDSVGTSRPTIFDRGMCVYDWRCTGGTQPRPAVLARCLPRP